MPSTGSFIPLVALIVAGFPGLVNWIYGNLSSAEAAWGLRGFDVLRGNFWLTGTPVPAIPPFFAWCEAAALAIPLGDPIWRLSLPSFFFWLLAAGVIYRFVERWHDDGTALATLSLLAVNPIVLDDVRRGLPSTCALFWSMLGLMAYIEHLKAAAPVRSWWTAMGGGSLGMLMLTTGLTALWLPALVSIHLVYHLTVTGRQWRDAPLAVLRHPTFRSLIAGGLVAAAIVAPWAWAIMMSGRPSADGVIIEQSDTPLVISALPSAMPATLILGIFGLILAIRRRIRGTADESVTLINLWCITGFIAYVVAERSTTGLLLLVVPLTILAIRSLLLVLERQLRDRTSFLLIVVSVAALVISISVGGLWPGAIPSPADENSATGDFHDLGWMLFRAHLAIDLVLIFTGGMIWLYRASVHRDHYRRILFGGFAAAVILGSVLIGGAALRGPLRSNDPWRELYDRLAERPAPRWYAGLGRGQLAAEPAFILRAIAPDAPLETALDLGDLDNLLDRRDGIPIVVVQDDRATLLDSFTLTQTTRALTFTLLDRASRTPVYAVNEKLDQP